MLEDTLDMDEDEELEEEADAEVDKVLFDLTDGKLGLAGSVDTELPVSLVNLSLRNAHIQNQYPNRLSRLQSRMKSPNR